MHHGEQIGLSRHEPAFVIPSPFDQPVDRSGDQGIVQIELRFHEVRLGALQGRFGREVFGHGVIHVLLTDRLLARAAV